VTTTRRLAAILSTNDVCVGDVMPAVEDDIGFGHPPSGQPGHQASRHDAVIEAARMVDRMLELGDLECHEAMATHQPRDRGAAGAGRS
jgi:hypothetical protein